MISPARENDKEADAAPKCEDVVEFRKGDVIKPDDIIVNVYNSGTEAGLAGATLDRMVLRGFKRGDAANAPAQCSSQERHDHHRRQELARPCSSWPSSSRARCGSSRSKTSTPGVDVVVGNDFVGIDTKAKRTLKIKKDVSSCTSTTASAAG